MHWKVLLYVLYIIYYYIIILLYAPLVMLCRQSYAIKNQVIASKVPLLGALERKITPTRGILVAPRYFFMAWGLLASEQCKDRLWASGSTHISSSNILKTVFVKYFYDKSPSLLDLWLEQGILWCQRRLLMMLIIIRLVHTLIFPSLPLSSPTY